MSWKIVIFHHSYGRFAGFCRYPSFWKMEISMNWHHISASSGKLPPNPLFSRIHVGLHKGYCKPAAQQTRCPHLQKGELTHVSNRTFSDATSLATVRNCGMFCRTGERVVHVIGISDGRMEPPFHPMVLFPMCLPIHFCSQNVGVPGNSLKHINDGMALYNLHETDLAPLFRKSLFYHFILCPPFHRNNKDWIGISFALT